MPFQAGKVAYHAGKTENDNPYICGTTKLGNPKMTEEGYDWLAGFNSCKARKATEAEVATAATVDVSRFRRKSNRYYR